MRWAGLAGSLVLVLLSLLPSSAAPQDEKPPEEKKEPEKKKKVDDKVVWGQMLQPSKLVSFSSSDLTAEIPLPDPAKIQNLANWQRQQMVSIAQAQNPQDYVNRMMQYKRELAQKQANETHTLKPVSFRVADQVKVRTMQLPVVYNEKTGKLKQFTSAELAALRGTQGLPGYATDLDALRPQQMVQLYLARPSATAPKTPRKKDDPEPNPASMYEPVVMVVILQSGQ